MSAVEVMGEGRSICRAGSEGNPFLAFADTIVLLKGIRLFAPSGSSFFQEEDQHLTWFNHHRPH